MVVAVVAYVLTGVACVWWDYRRPLHDRPAYVRDGDLLKLIPLVVVGWLPMKIMAAIQYRLWGDAVKSAVTFVVLLGLGLLFLR